MRLRFAVIIGLLLGHTLGILFAPGTALAVSGGIYISELQTGGSGTGHSSDEFIELYNATSNDISLKGWKVEYRPVSSSYGSDCAKGWSKSLSLDSHTIKANKYFLLKDANYPLVADASFRWDMSGTAGTVRVVGADGKVADALAWGDDPGCGFGSTATVSAGQSLERLPGLQAPQGGNAYDTGDNANDFVVRQAPEPQSSSAPAETPLQFAGPGQDATGSLEISEVFVSPGTGSSAAPFLEFHNTGASALMLSSYIIKLGAAGYYLPQKVVLPGAYVIVQSETFPLNLNPAGGEVSLVDPRGNVADQASWLSAPSGASFIWTNDGWAWTAKPTPGLPNEYLAPPEASSYAPLEITELLPDPAAPATDAEDEFIEVHNPTDSPVDIAGYVLKTGSTLSDNYILPAEILPPNGYIAIKSGDSQLSLANGGSTVALFDPTGQQTGEMIVYTSAKPGESWAKFGTTWNWTTNPSPAGPNIFAAPVVAGVAKKAKASAAKTTGKVKSAAVAKKATAKSKVAKSKTAKSKATKAKTSKKTTGPLVAAAQSPAGHWLLFALAGLTIAYIIYEFRYDLRNIYYKLRGYPGSRPAPSPAPEGRGDAGVAERPRGRQDNLRSGSGPGPRLQW